MVFFLLLILVVVMKSNDYDFLFGQLNIIISQCINDPYDAVFNCRFSLKITKITHNIL